MAKLPRVTAKVFASQAAPEDIGQYGSALTGSKVETSDISEIQALPAYEEGWRGAVISGRNYPTLQEMNGLQKSFSQQIAYTLQNGMPEWDTGTDYFINQFCRVGTNFYFSKTDNNIGNNPVTDTQNWEIWKPFEGSYANTSLSNLTSAGEAHFANPGLSNLSAAGQAKLDRYVKKTGDVMTGTLKFEQAAQMFLPFNRTDIEIGTTGSERRNVGGYSAQANGVTLALIQGFVETDGATGLQMVTRNPDNSRYGAGITVMTLVDGTQIFEFPKCTTKATTTSSASNSKVAVVVQNYVNGNSWYRVWSDGWIEQGSNISITSHTTKTVTLPKPFSNTNYTLNFTQGGWADGNERSDTGITAITTTSFTIGSTSGCSSLGRWYACGY